MDVIPTPVPSTPATPALAALAGLPAGAPLTVGDLARVFGRHPKSILLAVRRGELPPGVRLFNHLTWTLNAIMAHLERRQQAALTLTARRAAKNSALAHLT